MKLGLLNMNLKSLKSHLNHQKSQFFKGKSTKIAAAFVQNKPNSPIVQTYVTFFKKMIYTIFASLTKVKSKPNSKPKQTQSPKDLK